MRKVRPPHGRRITRTAALLAGAVALLALGLPAAPAGALAPRQPLWGSGDPRVEVTVATRQGEDQYRATSTADGFRVSADDANVGANTRVFIQQAGADVEVDGESCATWGERNGAITQLGAALRVARQDGDLRAITVTQNIFVSPFAFNIHTWDSSRRGAPYRQVAAIDMRERFFAFGIVSFPWHFCARAIDDRVEFKVWGAGEREPRWGDPFHSDGATLPEGWDHAGTMGWFAGHLEAGDHVDLDDPTTWAYRYQQSMIPVARRR